MNLLIKLKYLYFSDNGLNYKLDSIFLFFLFFNGTLFYNFSIQNVFYISDH